MEAFLTKAIIRLQSRQRKDPFSVRQPGAAVASGLVLALAHPYADVGPLAWIALVPLLISLRTARWRESVWLGYLAGVAFFGVLVSWAATFGYAAWVALALYQAVFWAAFGALAGPLCRRGGWGMVLGVPAAWVLLEWARAWGALGFTWGSLAVSQHANLPVLQLGAIGGPYLISLVVATANAAVADLLSATGVLGSVGHGSATGGARLWPSAATLALVVAAVAAGWVRLGGVRAHEDTGPVLRAGLVQAGINRVRGGDFEDPYLALATYERLTLGLRGRASLVVWPETAVPTLAIQDPGIRARLLALARRADVTLAVGAFEANPSGRLSNCIDVIASSGRAVGRYAKVHLVPFGEYVPAPRFRSFLMRWGVPSEDLVPGRARRPINTTVARLGPLICFESSQPEAAREQVRQGAQVLLVATNDAWFGTTAAGRQHLAFCALRAAENGRYVLRAATTGVTACFDDSGRLVAQAPVGGQATLPANVRLRSGLTPYAKYGDWPVWLALAMLLGSYLVCWGWAYIKGKPAAGGRGRTLG